MVTGVETAGLILGSIPLIIEGLKTYQKGIKSVKRSFKYDVSLRKIIRRVEGQKFFFEDNLRKLLNGANTHLQDHIELEDDFWTGLSAGVVNQAVKEYLGERKQQHFYDLLDDFEQYFVKIGNTLNQVQRASKNDSHDDHMTLSELYSLAKAREIHGKHVSKRVQYLIKEEDIIELIKELDELNSEMSRLLADSSILAQRQNIQESRLISDERSAKALASLLYRLQTYAERLFNAFRSAWTPDCHASHDVALFLDTPTVPKSGFPALQSSFTFRMMICGKAINVAMSSSWHEANVTVFEDSGATTNQGAISSPAKPVTGQINVPPKITVTTLSPAPPSFVLNKVTNLCDAAVRAKQKQRYLDLILRNGTSLVSDGIGDKQCETAVWSTVNLERYLTTHKMSPGKKVKLALKLAISLLQFKASQWFQSSVSAQVIYFREAVQSSRTTRIEVDEPLVLQSFHDQISENPSGHKPREMLLELGILLMEIWNGETLATFAKRHSQIDDVPPLMRQGLATEWYDETLEQMTINYGGVVNTCIAFALDRDRRTQTWEDEDLRKSICGKIISPLNEDCMIFP